MSARPTTSSAWQGRLSRRSALQLAASGGSATAALTILGCGSSNNNNAGNAAPTQARGTSRSATAAAASTGAPPATRAAASPTAAAAAQLRPGGEIKLAYQTEAPHLDVQASTSNAIILPMSLVYNRLYRPVVGPGVPYGQWEVTGDLAASNEHPDPLTYTVKLQAGVKYQTAAPVNGRALTADDIVYSFDRILQLKGQVAATISYLDKIEAVDPTTVRFTLKSPYAGFINWGLGGNYLWIAPKEIVAVGGDLKTHAVGTGPYVVADRRPNEQTTFNKNPGFFRSGLPYADKITRLIQPDLATRTAAFTAGQIDTLGAGNKQQANQVTSAVKSAQSLAYLSGPENLVFRVDKPPFNDMRVRQAFSLALDRQGMISSAASGDGAIDAHIPQVLSDWALPQAQWGSDGNFLRKRDVAMAKQLLAAAGHGDGLHVTYTTFIGAGDVSDSVHQLVQASLKDAGVTVDLKPMEYATWISSIFSGQDYDGMTMFAGAVFPSPENYTWDYFHPGGRINLSHTNDDALNALLDKTRTASSNQELKSMYDDISKYLLKNLFTAPIISVRNYALWQSRLKGYSPHQSELYTYDTLIVTSVA